MFFIHHILLEIMLGIIPLLPMMALFQFVMFKKTKNSGLKIAASHVIATYLFSVVLLSILSATGITAITSSRIEMNINLVPLTELSTNFVQYVENILLFIPFGFLLPMLWKRFEKKQRTFICGFLFSLSIEIMQIFSYRITDIDDLLMNTAGTIAGYFLFIWIKGIFPRLASFSIGDANLWKWEPVFYFNFAWVSMLFIQPVITSWVFGPIILR